MFENIKSNLGLEPLLHGHSSNMGKVDTNQFTFIKTN